MKRWVRIKWASVKRWKQRWHQFGSLAPTDRLLLLSAWLGLIIIRLGLFLFPFQTLRSGLTKWVAVHHPLFSPLSVDQIVWAVEIASRLQPGGVKCLARALFTQSLLVQQGYPAQLRIGVAKSSIGQLEAHAWVEHQGEIVIGALPQLASFTPLPALEFGNKG
ncbi:MAG: lasso peptide biosynthesis B2 protein [Elainella sp. Prado103]|jgi:hypothetical protein|nr:lasso peptide biosynthesis B2 protein [Elainella sp. Prado103]